MENKVIFESKTHKYYINNEEYPSVTTILNIINKPALLYWGVGEAVSYFSENLDKIINGELKLDKMSAGKILAEARTSHEKKKDEAANIGHIAHKIVEQINRNEPINPIDNPKVQSAVNAFTEWKKETGFEPIEAEFIVYSKKHRFAGMIDCVGKINNEKVIVDFKTSNAIYPNMELQVTAYWGAYREMFPDDNIKTCHLARFGKQNGEFEKKKISIKDLVENYKAFLSAKKLWEWNKKHSIY